MIHKSDELRHNLFEPTFENIVLLLIRTEKDLDEALKILGEDLEK